MANYQRFLAFGEVLLRLSPPAGELFVDRPSLAMHVGGSEANVAAALAGLGYRATVATVLSDHALGDTALAALRSAGVDVDHVRRGPGRMGLYWVETGADLRPSAVVYDRAGSAFARSDRAAWIWPAILTGADRLHLSGITVASGENTTQIALDFVRAAKRAGVPISFDGNYRAQLWAERDRVEIEPLRELAGAADILFGDHRDINLLLGHTFLGDTPQARRLASEAAFEAFPNLRLIASTVRLTPHVGEHILSVRVDTAEAGFETEPLVLPGVVDRVGSGDAFAAGILHADRTGATLAGIAESGLALAALKHSVLGDMSRITARQVTAFVGGSKDVRR